MASGKWNQRKHYHLGFNLIGTSLLAKYGFAVDRLEEWVGNRESQPGPRADAENTARKEIPLFLYLRAKHIGE